MEKDVIDAKFEEVDELSCDCGENCECKNENGDENFPNPFEVVLKLAEKQVAIVDVKLVSLVKVLVDKGILTVEELENTVQELFKEEENLHEESKTEG